MVGWEEPSNLLYSYEPSWMEYNPNSQWHKKMGNSLTMMSEYVLDIMQPYLVFAGPVRWAGKKTEIELNPTAKDRTTGFGFTNSEFFRLPVATFVEKSKNRKNRSRSVATGLSSRHVLDLTHAHSSLIVGL